MINIFIFKPTDQHQFVGGLLVIAAHKSYPKFIEYPEPNSKSKLWERLNNTHHLYANESELSDSQVKWSGYHWVLVKELHCTDDILEGIVALDYNDA